MRGSVITTTALLRDGRAPLRLCGLFFSPSAPDHVFSASGVGRREKITGEVSCQQNCQHGPDGDEEEAHALLRYSEQIAEEVGINQNRCAGAHPDIQPPGVGAVGQQSQQKDLACKCGEHA